MIVAHFDYFEIIKQATCFDEHILIEGRQFLCLLEAILAKYVKFIICTLYSGQLCLVFICSYQVSCCYTYFIKLL